MADLTGPVPISADEIAAHLSFAARVLQAADDEARRAALSEQLITFAHRSLYVWHEMVGLAPADQQAFYQGVLDQVVELYALWMRGNALTDRPDEPERRALAGKLLLEERGDQRTLQHYAAQAILELPEGHPMRDMDLVRRALHDQVTWLDSQGDDASWISYAGSLGILFRERLATDEELDGWRGLVETVAAHLEPSDALRLWSTVEGYCVERAGADPARWLEEARQVRARIEALPMTPRMRAESYLAAARLHTRSDDQRPIAELYRQALETGALGDRVDRMIATREARVRTGHDEHARVVELLSGRLAAYESAYLAAIREDERKDRGEDCAEASVLLAFALARLGRWSEAVEVMERGKCLRQRQTLLLRGLPEAGQLLEIEGELFAWSRGLATRSTPALERVKDWLAAGLTPEAQLLEEYRKVLPSLDARRPPPVTVPGLVAALREGEAALSLGVWWMGLCAALLAPGYDTPSWTVIRDDVTQRVVMEWMAGNDVEGEGFLLALERGMAVADPRPHLRTLIARLDEALGRPVAEAMRAQGLSKLVVLPHNVLRLAPLWALPSWDGFDVRLLPGGFALATAPTVPYRRRAMVVSNPTGDLTLAPAEAQLAVTHLTEGGVAVSRIAGPAATEAALVDALPDAGLFHFAGHGIASLTDGSLSALLVAADWPETPVPSPAEMSVLDGASPPGTRLTVDREEGSPRRKVYLEYARQGTLYAECEGAQVLLAGELWRAGDLLVQGTLRGCGLAFLSACSSGLGAIPTDEEASGLPAALGVAGVGSVVSSGWPVADEVALLFADEFYRRARPGSGGEIDVLGAVSGASRALREMTRDEAVRRLQRLAEDAPDRGARLRLRVAMRRIGQGPEHPFADPFDSRAFFVTGAASLRLEPLA